MKHLIKKFVATHPNLTASIIGSAVIVSVGIGLNHLYTRNVVHYNHLYRRAEPIAIQRYGDGFPPLSQQEKLDWGEDMYMHTVHNHAWDLRKKLRARGQHYAVDSLNIGLYKVYCIIQPTNDMLEDFLKQYDVSGSDFYKHGTYKVDLRVYRAEVFHDRSGMCVKLSSDYVNPGGAYILATDTNLDGHFDKLESKNLRYEDVLEKMANFDSLENVRDSILKKYR